MAASPSRHVNVALTEPVPLVGDSVAPLRKGTLTPLIPLKAVFSAVAAASVRPLRPLRHLPPEVGLLHSDQHTPALARVRHTALARAGSGSARTRCCPR